MTMTSIYRDPRPYGLEFVGEIEWCGESYRYDVTAVWASRDTMVFYWLNERGCSCPVPFDTVTSLDQLCSGNVWQVVEHLRRRDALRSETLVDLVRRWPLP